MSDDDNYGSEEEYEYQYSDEDDDNSSSQPMAIDSDVDDASDGSRKRKAGTAGSNGGGGAADSRRRSGSNVHNAMMELIDGGGGELPVCVRVLILGVGGCVAVAGCKPPRSPGRSMDFGRHPRAGVEYRTGRIANFGGGSCPGLTEAESK